MLLYELLTGTTPFPEKRLRSAGYGEMQRIIAEEEPERPSTRLSTMENAQRTTVARNRSMEVLALGRLLRGDLDWIAMKCLEKDRTRRYETANGLEADLRHHLNNEPVLARPPSAFYRAWKFARRHRVVLGFTAATTSLALGLLVLSVRVAVVESRRAEELERQKQLAVGASKRAARGEADARRLLYIANMNVAQQAWETASGKELLTLSGHIDSFHLIIFISVAFSSDGRRIVTSSTDGKTKVWEAANGTLLLTLSTHGEREDNVITCMALAVDGRRIVTGSRDQTAKLWNTDTGRELLSLKGHSAWISSVAISCGRPADCNWKS